MNYTPLDNTKTGNPVVCLDKDGKFLAEYSSASYAARCLKIDTSCITRCLYGKSLITNDKYFFVLKEYYSSEKNYSLKFRKLYKQFKNKK